MLTVTEQPEDLVLPLAFSMASNHGAYALLIGAGTSYASGIPVAWEVLMNLCRRVAAAKDVDIAGQDPDEWWRDTYDEDPTYGSVLEKLAPTRTLRQRLLEAYFEPTAEDVREGKKQPTSAHIAIADLVKSGVVKVIITLNFDRLIETALREAGLEPTVVSSHAEFAGMRPLHQQEALIVHLHGDYKNPETMLNTDAELETYPAEVKRFLQLVLSDYGLIACGWSATHDHALRREIAAHHNVARYPLWWIEPGQQSEEATNLLNAKRGTVLRATADTGLGLIAETVSALMRRRARNPLSLPVAVASTKRELQGERLAIDSHDALSRLFAALHEHPDLEPGADETGEYGYLGQLDRLMEAARIPSAISATLAYWSRDSAVHEWWIPELERFSFTTHAIGEPRQLNTRRVLGLHLFYSAGVSAVAAHRYDVLHRILNMRITHRENSRERQSLAEFYSPQVILGSQVHSAEFFKHLSPDIAVATGLGPQAIDEAWQRFELLRNAIKLRSNPDTSAKIREYEAAKAEFDRLNLQHGLAERNGDNDLAAIHAVRAEALIERDKALGDLARLARLSTPVHLLATVSYETYPEGRWYVPEAVRIQRDMQPLPGQKESRLHAAGFNALGVHLQALSLGFGWAARDEVRRRIQDGTTPQSIWMDTWLTMAQSGTKTLPR